MPELPEIETTYRAICQPLLGQTIKSVVIRHHRLRWPLEAHWPLMMKGAKVLSLSRRAKYILVATTQGYLLLHLGMSGRLSLLPRQTPHQKHDHVDCEFGNKLVLRYTDPRRFGAFLWFNSNPDLHPLLCNLGVEPLTQDFNAAFLYQQTRKRKVAIKQLIMNAKIVVGVGNIYANEALFEAGIDPRRLSQSLKLEECAELIKRIKQVLKKAIQAGGTTLKDFLSPGGHAGYFVQVLKVYGKEDKPCFKCQSLLVGIRLHNRATVFCPSCQR